jgi:hypothetical protein
MATSIDRHTFFTGFRDNLEPDNQLSQQQVNSINNFLDMLEKDLRGDKPYLTRNQAAYILATVYHETNRTFAPVREAYWLSEEWRKKNLRYYPWYGRGYVQLTWEANYRKMGQRLGKDFTANPDMVMQPLVAYDVLTVGMMEGRFTSVSLPEYVSPVTGECNYAGARRVVNGTDRADQIAGYARTFQEILEKAWREKEKPEEDDKDKRIKALEQEVGVLKETLKKTQAALELEKRDTATLREGLTDIYEIAAHHYVD